ncbi:hypothetical protein AAC387_Pa04g1046 [Persea americana]
MAEARSSSSSKPINRKKEEDEEEAAEKPKILPPISIPDRSSAEALFKANSGRGSSETLTLAEQDHDCRSFSQLLAGAMASPAAAAGNSPTAPVLEMKPTLVLTLAVDPARFPLVAQPAFIGVLAQGQFGMSHQEALASVTAQAHAHAQAQMQLQTGYASPSLAIPSKPLTQPVLSALSPTPLQQRMPLVPEDNVSTADMEQHTSSDQKAQSAHGNVKTPSTDGYNWRKYGQKQVKSSESSRSYYRCTHANCGAKKKVERCHDGQIAEIIYKGHHNHEPPQKIRCKKEGEAPSGGPSGGNDTGDIPGENLSESNPSISRTEQTSCHTTPELQLQCSSNCDGDANTRSDEERGDEPDPKRRIKDNTVSHSAPLLKTVKEPKVVVQTGGDPGNFGDGYRWRKYGQKIVKGNPNPRSYYKCTHVGCSVRKHVERASDDENALIITYEGKHNHECPASKNSYDPPSTALVTVPVSTVEHLETSDLPHEPPLIQSPTDVEGKLSGEKAKELGGDKALESAQTLLSIGLNSNSSEDAGAKNPNVIQRPLFNENSSAVSV